MLSRSSDLTKFRMTKVEPEPAIPLRINAASPEDWSPPFHRASKAWEESQDSLQVQYLMPFGRCSLKVVRLPTMLVIVFYFIESLESTVQTLLCVTKIPPGKESCFTM